jgi:hypothetical protein
MGENASKACELTEEDNIKWVLRTDDVNMEI